MLEFRKSFLPNSWPPDVTLYIAAFLNRCYHSFLICILLTINIYQLGNRNAVKDNELRNRNSRQRHLRCTLQIKKKKCKSGKVMSFTCSNDDKDQQDERKSFKLQIMKETTYRSSGNLLILHQILLLVFIISNNKIKYPWGQFLSKLSI